MIGGMRLLGKIELVGHLAKGATVVGKETDGLVRMYGQMLTTRIQANASGRPGPNAPTGNYRRSWSTNFESRGGTATSISGTNMPQGRRLEYGFVGADSLGRVYDQPPFPHAGPALAEIGPQFVKAVQLMVRSVT